MVHFEGDKEFDQTPAELSNKLTDTSFLAQCIPDVASVSISEPGKLVCKLQPGFTFVRGTLDLTLLVIEVVAGSSARLMLHTKGIGSSSEVEVLLTFAPQGTGSRVHWTAHVKSLGGLLKALPQGLIRAAAQKVIADAWTALETKLGATPGS